MARLSSVQAGTFGVSSAGEEVLTLAEQQRLCLACRPRPYSSERHSASAFSLQLSVVGSLCSFGKRLKAGRLEKL